MWAYPYCSPQDQVATTTRVSTHQQEKKVWSVAFCKDSAHVDVWIGWTTPQGAKTNDWHNCYKLIVHNLCKVMEVRGHPSQLEEGKSHTHLQEENKRGHKKLQTHQSYFSLWESNGMSPPGNYSKPNEGDWEKTNGFTRANQARLN